jgi:tight adherence protein C
MQYLFAAVASGVGSILILLDPIINWDLKLRGLIVLGFAYLGFRIPIMQEESVRKRRRADIEDDFSGVIDLLVIMLDSGTTLDEALSRFLTDKHFPDRPIKQELAQLAHELAISPNRQKAFEKFAETTQLDILRLFNSVLIQSELYGTPASRGLRGLAIELRQKQYNALEAKSSSLGPKLTIPMTLFFMPLIFIVVLAPTLIRAFKLS